MNENENKEAKLLNNVYKCAKMADVSIETVKEQSHEYEFKQLISRQSDEYKDIESQAAMKLYAMGEEPGGVGQITRAMMWGNVKIKTINDASASKLADMLIRGTNMGIIDIQKGLNDCKNNVDTDSEALAQRLMDTMSDNVNELKAYL